MTVESEKNIEALKKENFLLDSKVIELYTLYSISKKLSMTLQLEEIFDGTMEHISKSLEIDDYCVFLWDGKKEKLSVNAYYGDTELDDISFQPGEGITGDVAVNGKVCILQDVSKSKDFLFYRNRKKNIGSFMCMPLKEKAGTILGTLNVHKNKPDSFDEKSIELFLEVASQLEIAIEKALAFQTIKELSIRDELTELYNRRYFFDFFEREISRAKRYGHKVSIIIVDIDHFKNFNDKNGHIMGDGALKLVAKTMNTALRKSDIIARLGGEEFIVVLPETPREFALIAAEKIRAAVEEETIKGEENQPGGKLIITLGVASYPEDAEFASELVDCADMALYKGKNTSRNIVSIYNSEEK